MGLFLMFSGLLVAIVLAAAVAIWLLAKLYRSNAAAQQEVVAAIAAQLRAERAQEMATTVDTVLALAGDKLGSHLQAGSAQLDARGDVIAQQLHGMAGELRRVTDVVGALHRDKAEQHGQLMAGLADSARHNASLASSTQQLREMLSSTKARGQWGERMADDVLRLAGFLPGVNYHRQVATSTGSVPDFTFLLPQGQLLHMDVKFPLDNYARYLSASSPEEGRAYATQFLKDTRARIKEITGRGYIAEGETLGFVLLFIPNEAVYGFIHEHDPAVADLALRHRVVLCSPFTLFAMLAVIRQAVDSFNLQRSTADILSCLGGFSNQWEKFSGAVDQLGRRLESSSRAFEELAGPRRRQLQRMVDRVEDLRRSQGVGSAEQPERGGEGELGDRVAVLPLVDRSDAALSGYGPVDAIRRRLTG